MNKILTILLLISAPLFVKAQIPAWYTAKFKALKLDQRYNLSAFAKPSYQQADFNGDGVKDIAALIIQKGTKKKGILLIEGESNRYFVFGAGTKVGMPNFDETDDLGWLKRWQVMPTKEALMPKLDKDGMVISYKAFETPSGGIVLWRSKIADIEGSLIYWNSEEYYWGSTSVEAITIKLTKKY